MAGRMEIRFGSVSGQRPRETEALNILVLGDASGRESRGTEGAADLSTRRVSQVDIDTFDRVFERLAPTLELELGGGTTTIEFEELDDFHPDALFEKLALFGALRTVRERLLDPRTFENTARELGGRPASTGSPPAGGSEGSESGSLFESLLGGPAGRTAPGRIDDMIRAIVGPHIVPSPDPQLGAYVASVDEAIASLMSHILHAPAFQRLESLWRGIRRLVTRVETASDLRIFLLDVSRRELRESFATTSSVHSSALHEILCGRGTSYSLVVGDVSIEPTPEDLGLLVCLGILGSHAGGPFLGTATADLVTAGSADLGSDPSSWGSLPEEVDAVWREIRSSPVAPWVGLLAPRILARQPYGAKSDPIDGFDYEELGETLVPTELLWGSPAIAAAELIGRSFSRKGWAMRSEDHLQLEDLPVVVREADDEIEQQSPTEHYLSDRHVEAIQKRGVMPLVSARNRDVARLAGFHSIGEPATRLAAAWETS